MKIDKWLKPMYAPEGEGAGGGAGEGAGAGGGGTPWHQGVDAEILGHWQNKAIKFDDPKTVAIEMTKAARSAELHFGVPPDRLLKLPKDASDEAGWKNVYARLGVPTEAKDYDFAGVKRSDGTDIDAALADALRPALLNARVPKERGAEVAAAIIKHQESVATAQAAEAQAKLTEEKAALAALWGQNKDINLLTAMQGAKRAAGSDEAGKALVSAMEAKIGYKATMEFFRKIGAGTSEDTFVEGKTGQQNQPMTTEAAIARKAELMGDTAWAKRFLDGDAAAVREMAAIDMMISGYNVAA